MCTKICEFRYFAHSFIQKYEKTITILISIIIPFIISTDAEYIAIEVKEETPKQGVHVSGHVILNKFGIILAQNKSYIKRSSMHKYFLPSILQQTLGIQFLSCIQKEFHCQIFLLCGYQHKCQIL